jgi:hypothetical protein
VKAQLYSLRQENTLYFLHIITQELICTHLGLLLLQKHNITHLCQKEYTLCLPCDYLGTGTNPFGPDLVLEFISTKQKRQQNLQQQQQQ